MKQRLFSLILYGALLGGLAMFVNYHLKHSNARAKVLVENPRSTTGSSAEQISPAPQHSHVTPVAPPATSASHGNYHCHSVAKGKPTELRTKVYKWLDEYGRAAYSDAAPGDLEFEIVDLGTRGKDYFDLSTNTRNVQLPAEFTSELRARITKTYQILSRMIALEKIQRVAVNMELLGNQADYQKARQRYAKNISANSLGFYSGNHNLAVVLASHNEQTAKTALHEAAHVINHGIMMATPRWLNEGLAEYFEQLKAFASAATVHPNSYALNYLRQHGNRPLAEFLRDERWQDSNNQRNYATAWGLIYFLMDSRNNRALLAELLNQVTDDRCANTDTAAWLQRRYPGGVRKLEQDFRRWMQSKPLAHHH